MYDANTIRDIVLVVYGLILMIIIGFWLLEQCGSGNKRDLPFPKPTPKPRPRGTGVHLIPPNVPRLDIPPPPVNKRLEKRIEEECK